MTRRLLAIVTVGSLLLGPALPVAADEPLDPAGQPTEPTTAKSVGG